MVAIDILLGDVQGIGIIILITFTNKGIADVILVFLDGDI